MEITMQIDGVALSTYAGVVNSDETIHTAKHVFKHVAQVVFSVGVDNNCTTFAATVPVLHTIRTAFGSFFLYSYGQ